MVGVASSGVGSLIIKGQLEDSMIQQGFQRIQSGFERTKGVAKGLGADMVRLGSAVGDIAKSFIKIGSVGLGALTGLAMMSPALAGSLAKIKIELFKLGNIFGQYVRPVFDAIANDLLPALSSFVEKNKDWIKTLFGGGAEAIGDLSKLISGEWSAIQNIIPKTGTAITMAAAGGILGGPIGAFFGLAVGWSIASIGATKGDGVDGVVDEEILKLKNAIPVGMGVTMAAAGFKMGGPKGAILGFALGTVLGDAISEPPDSYKEQYGSFANTIHQLDQNTDMAREGNYGGYTYGLFKAGGSSVVDSFRWLFSKLNRRDMEMAIPQGSAR